MKLQKEDVKFLLIYFFNSLPNAGIIEVVIDRVHGHPGDLPPQSVQSNNKKARYYSCYAKNSSKTV
jgi:hypothetical protein